MQADSFKESVNVVRVAGMLELFGVHGGTLVEMFLEDLRNPVSELRTSGTADAVADRHDRVEVARLKVRTMARSPLA